MNAEANMFVELLIEDHMFPVPESIQMNQNYGELIVVFGDTSRRGLQCIMEGSKDDFVKWLSPFDSVVVGDGPSPACQTFSLRHISDDAMEKFKPSQG